MALKVQQSIRMTRLRPALGTFVAFEADAASQNAAEAAINAAAAAIVRVEALLHPTRPGSDLWALACSAAHVEVAVDPWTYELLELSQLLHRLSGGVFDPCLPKALGRMRDVELRAPHRVITHAAVSIDLGGIAKGFAVDRAIEAMRRMGCTSALVNAGGDLRVDGLRSHEISCRLPSGECQTLTLSGVALAVSRLEAEDRPPEHQGYYRHDGDHTAACAAAMASTAAAILAPSAAVADALTKCALLCTPQACSGILNHFNARRLF